MNKTFLLLILNVYAMADSGGRAEALSSNADEFYRAILSMAHSGIWVFAVIPVLLIGWAMMGTMNHLKRFFGGSQDSAKLTIIERYVGVLMAGVLALTSLFLIYGIFVTTYADPNGNMSFLDSWNKLVVTFWREVASKI